MIPSITMPSPEQLAILNQQIAPAAVECERSTGLPAELTTAQCIFESGWLAHCPGNNCFGIKADAHGSGVDYVQTREWKTGAYITEPLAFETYASLTDCFVDHARLITEGTPYHAAWSQYAVDHNRGRLMLAIGPIYATAPGYGQQISAEAQTWYVTAALQDARATLA